MKRLKNNCFLNYHGSKGKFYNKIKHLLPDVPEIECLDLFAGGASLSSMLPDNWNITCNDKIWDIGKMQGQFLSDYKDSEQSADDWVASLAEGSLVKNKDDLEGYLEAKKCYNKLKDSTSWERSYIFFDLVCSSFSNYIRFNDSGEWNLNFGKRYFNPSMQNKLVSWLERMEKKKSVEFTCNDWRDMNFEDYSFIIIDPPYLNTCAQYNSSWKEEDTIELLKAIDGYVALGGEFIMFEEVLSKGTPNKIITDWMKKYKHVTLGDESSGCNYQRKDGITLEVCIYN